MPAAESSVVIKVVGGAVVSALMAVGGMSWTTHTENQTQEVRIAQLERLITQVSGLTEKLAITNQNIAILNVKLAVLEEDLDEAKSERRNSE